MPARPPSARRWPRHWLFGYRPAGPRLSEVIRTDTFGGALLLTGVIAALGWANSPWSRAYAAFCDYAVGPAALGLDLSVSQWTGDGLLAIFFFVAGLELKREFVLGDLSDPRRAVVPVAAAVGGVIAPALIYLVLNLAAEGGSLRGWAVPTATDIAFALGALAVMGSHLPSALRTFLLTLAVVDDLIAIAIIAIWYTDDLRVWAVLAALVPLAAFAVLTRRGRFEWWALLPLALLVWALVHASGVHATVAGVLLGFAVPARPSPSRPPHRSSSADGDGPVARETTGPAEAMERRWRPVSSLVAVPLFALTDAGVAVGGLSGLADALSSPIAYGVAAALVVGKAVGVFGATFLSARFTRADLDPGLAWIDVLGLALLCGIGFTVSLLVGGLAFGTDSPHDHAVRLAVLTGSLTATVLAAVVLRSRERVYRRLAAAEVDGRVSRP